MIRVNTKKIVVCNEPIDLTKKSDKTVINDPIKWENVIKRHPLCTFESAQRLYINIIINFSKIMLKDKYNNTDLETFFFVNEFRNEKCLNEMYNYLISKPKLLAKQFITHFNVVIEAIGEYFTPEDFFQYRNLENDIEKYTDFKQSEHSKIKILPWENIYENLETLILLSNTRHIKILAHFLSKGYVIRLYVYTRTQLLHSEDDCIDDKITPTFNVITGHFYIPQQKSSGASFFVDKDTLDVYKKLFYKKTDKFLLTIDNKKSTFKNNTENICDKDYSFNSKQNISIVFYKAMATSRIRKSFLTHYVTNVAVSIDDIKKITGIVGNLPRTLYYSYIVKNKGLSFEQTKILTKYFSDYEEDTDENY
jgi:hypothetical protein